MSKNELLRLYKTTVAEKEKIAQKCGQFPYISHCTLITLYYYRAREGPEEVLTHKEGS